MKIKILGKEKIIFAGKGQSQKPGGSKLAFFETLKYSIKNTKIFLQSYYFYWLQKAHVERVGIFPGKKTCLYVFRIVASNPSLKIINCRLFLKVVIISQNCKIITQLFPNNF